MKRSRKVGRCCPVAGNTSVVAIVPGIGITNRQCARVGSRLLLEKVVIWG